MVDDDQKWMAEALLEAAKGLGLTAPNPPVGAVVTRDGILLGRGWHRRAGTPHAEHMAINDAIANHGSNCLHGATVYVTLEPCCTSGRTPPCTNALIDARVARVVYAVTDPNPAHAGRADAILLAAGISVTHGVCAAEAALLLRGFQHAVLLQRPWVIGKSAMALDGSITRPSGEQPWLTNMASRGEVQRLRATVDGILTSGETVRRDNPALTLRIPHPHGEKTTPWRIIATRSGRLPRSAKVFTDTDADRTVVLAIGIPPPLDLPACVRVLTASDWQDALRQLTATLGIHRLLVEAGGGLLGSLFDARLIDEWLGWFAPLLSGTGKTAILGSGHSSSATLTEIEHQSFGGDILVRGRVSYRNPDNPPPRPAVFFDRDGVVNDPGEKYYVTSLEDFRFTDGITAALRTAKAAGRALVLITSQRGVGKGVMDATTLESIHAMMQESLAKEGVAFDAIYAYTGAEPDGPGAKPDPYFIHRAAADLDLDLASSWMIGDADRDIIMGQRAGLGTIRVSGDKPLGTTADYTVGAVAELAPLLKSLLGGAPTP